MVVPSRPVHGLRSHDGIAQSLSRCGAATVECHSVYLLRSIPISNITSVAARRCGPVIFVFPRRLYVADARPRPVVGRRVGCRRGRLELASGALEFDDLLEVDVAWQSREATLGDDEVALAQRAGHRVACSSKFKHKLRQKFLRWPK